MASRIMTSLFISCVTVTLASTAQAELMIEVDRSKTSIGGNCDLNFSMINGTQYFFNGLAFNIEAYNENGEFLGDGWLYEYNVRPSLDVRGDALFSDIPCMDIGEIVVRPATSLVVRDDTGRDWLPYNGSKDRDIAFVDEFNKSVSVVSTVEGKTATFKPR